MGCKLSRERRPPLQTSSAVSNYSGRRSRSSAGADRSSRRSGSTGGGDRSSTAMDPGSRDRRRKHRRAMASTAAAEASTANPGTPATTGHRTPNQPETPPRARPSRGYAVERRSPFPAMPPSAELSATVPPTTGNTTAAGAEWLSSARRSASTTAAVEATPPRRGGGGGNGGMGRSMSRSSCLDASLAASFAAAARLVDRLQAPSGGRCRHCPRCRHCTAHVALCEADGTPHVANHANVCCTIDVGPSYILTRVLFSRVVAVALDAIYATTDFPRRAGFTARALLPPRGIKFSRPPRTPHAVLAFRPPPILASQLRTALKAPGAVTLRTLHAATAQRQRRPLDDAAQCFIARALAFAVQAAEWASVGYAIGGEPRVSARLIAANDVCVMPLRPLRHGARPHVAVAIRARLATATSPPLMLDSALYGVPLPRTAFSLAWALHDPRMWAAIPPAGLDDTAVARLALFAQFTAEKRDALLTLIGSVAGTQKAAVAAMVSRASSMVSATGGSTPALPPAPFFDAPPTPIPAAPAAVPEPPVAETPKRRRRRRSGRGRSSRPTSDEDEEEDVMPQGACDPVTLG